MPKSSPAILSRSEVSLQALETAFESAGFTIEQQEAALKLRSPQDGGTIHCNLTGDFVRLAATLETDSNWPLNDLLEASNAFNLENLSSATKLFITAPTAANKSGEGNRPGFATIETYASYQHGLNLDNLVALLYSLEDTVAKAVTGDWPWLPLSGARITYVHYRVAPGGKQVRAPAPRKQLPVKHVAGGDVHEALEAAYFLIDESDGQDCVVRCGSTVLNCVSRYNDEPAVFMIAPIESAPSIPAVKVNEAVNLLNESTLGVTAYAIPTPDGRLDLAFGTVVRTDCGLNGLELAAQAQRVASAMRALGWSSGVTE